MVLLFFIFISLLIISTASSLGIAKPRPSTDAPLSEDPIFTVLIPITCPCELTKAPPLFPGLIAASV